MITKNHRPQSFDTEYVTDCPFGNAFCLFGKFPGVGYRCWRKVWHTPINQLEQWRLLCDKPFNPWKMLIQTEGLDSSKDLLLKQVPEFVWSKNESDIGLVKSANPVELLVKPGAVLPFHRPYPVSPEAAVGLQTIVADLLKAGVIEPVHRPRANSPIFAIRKADGVRWRMLHDLRGLNNVLMDAENIVPSPHSVNQYSPRG